MKIMEEEKKTNGTSNDTKTIITVLLLIFAFPIGFLMMWIWTKWPMWIKIVISLPFILACAIIAIAISAGSKMPSSQVPTTQMITGTQTTPETSKKSADLTPKVGDVTKLGDREFTVNSVKRSKGVGYSTPKAGKEYVIVNVTIKNLGKEEVSYNPYDFKVQDANGAQESETYASLDDSLNSGTLAPNGKVTGSMPFEVPVGDKALLIFQPSFWSNQRIVVDLGSE